MGPMDNDKGKKDLKAHPGLIEAHGGY